MNQYPPAGQPSSENDPEHHGAQPPEHTAAGPPPPPPGPPPYGPGGDGPEPFRPYRPQAFDDEPYRDRANSPLYQPPYDPRQDPRWVYTGHDPLDETRPIPYFSGEYTGPDHYYEPPRRRRGPLHVIITGAGVIGFAILLMGFLSLVFDWEDNTQTFEEFFAPGPEDAAPEVLPETDSSADDLVESLDHIHEGITVDWEAGAQHTGPGLDPGQEVPEAPGVFMVDTQVYQYMGFGTGMVVSSDGLAVTNYHVVESSMSVSITMADTNQRYSATVLGRDASRDIAVLQIDTDEPLEVSSINPGEVSVGDTVAGVGNAGGQGYLTSVTGEVYATDETIHIEPQEPGSPAQFLDGLMMITSDIVPGYSGGPTVDANGQIIGVSTAASQNTTNSDEAYGYAVPIVSALEVVEQVLAGDDSGDVVIGAGGALGIVVASEEGDGARVIEVNTDAAAAEIGIRPDDLIIEIDGHEVVNSSFISRYVRDKNPGDEVDVVWQTPDGQVHEATAVLDEAEIN